MSHPIKKKKEIGAFYTPSDVARILSDWAIRSSEDTILEPSFGGCGFLEASRDRLLSLGTSNFANQINGCDIDRFAFEQLTLKFGLVNVSNRFILDDFLKVTPQCFSVHKFDAVIGNPPYISHHNMDKVQKQNALALLSKNDFILSGKASLWAYFVVHGISFVKDGGRMAWVLPGSFLNSKYGNDVKNILTANFGKVVAIVLKERIFLSEGAEERSVVVLCDNKGVKASQDLIIHYSDSISDLEDCIFSKGLNLGENSFSGRAAYDLLNNNERQLLTSIFGCHIIHHFGDIADVKIGIVTGDNSFFVVNELKTTQYGLTPAILKPIVAKYKMITGLILTQKDINREVVNGTRCLLVDTSRIRKYSSALIRYLETYPPHKLLANKTFAKRQPWHKADDGRTPDAFMSYMQHNGPKLALNSAGTTCTNTVHRVFFKNINKQKQKLAAISFISTITQISAEIEGRSYGSGVLKHEPSEARKLKVCLPNRLSGEAVNCIFKSVDRLLRDGKVEEARVEADKAIYAELKIDNKVASILNQVLVRLREIRQR